MAAVPSTWLTVTTPVPPIPARRTVNVSGSTIGALGSATAGGVDRSGRSAGSCADRSGTVTVAKEGQSPSRNETSKLQLPWWIRVLRPYGVSIGCTDRQLLLSPQSPQPSHTRSLITTRNPGVGIVPRARPRRLSAAQAWSWSSTVTPVVVARAASASAKRDLFHTSTPTGKSPRG